MKPLFTLLLFSFVVINANAQNTDNEEYLIARTVAKGFGNTYYLLYLDYSGAKAKDYIDPSDAVYDSSGHTIKFKLESGALNYLASQSWIMVSAIPVLSQGSSAETKYVFKRKITAEPLPMAKPTAE